MSLAKKSISVKVKKPGVVAEKRKKRSSYEMRKLTNHLPYRNKNAFFLPRTSGKIELVAGPAG